MDKKEIALRYLYEQVISSYQRGICDIAANGRDVWVRISNKSEGFNQVLYEMERSGEIQLEIHTNSIRVAVPLSTLIRISDDLTKECSGQ